MVTAAAARVLLDAVALADIHKPCLAGGAGLSILPGGEPPLGVVVQQRASGAAAHAGLDRSHSPKQVEGVLKSENVCVPSARGPTLWLVFRESRLCLSLSLVLPH